MSNFTDTNNFQSQCSVTKAITTDNKLQATPPPPPQPFYRPFSGTTRVSRCPKRTSGLYGARED